MKKGLLIINVLAISFSNGFAALAQQGPSGECPPGGKGNFEGNSPEFKQRMMQVFDTNRDGVLDDSERAQMREVMHQRRMQQGENPNSRGDAPEGAAAQRPGSPGFAPNGGQPMNDSQRQAFREKMMQRFDANRDGQLSDAERAQMRANIQKRKMERQGGFGGFPGQTGKPGN